MRCYLCLQHEANITNEKYSKKSEINLGLLLYGLVKIIN